jgi:hypothetical protein
MKRNHTNQPCSAGIPAGSSSRIQKSRQDVGATWKRRLRLALPLCLALAVTPAFAALQASLDRDHVAPGESVELTLQRDGRSDSQPDLAPLQRDFAIIGRASGSTYQIVNGSMSAQVQLRLQLSPKHGGHLQVPSLSWDGERSPALALEVDANSDAGGGAGPASAHLFVTSEVGQKRPYIQAATSLKVRIHTDQPMYQAGLDLAAGNDVLVQQIGKDRQFSETHGGRSYQVIERDYLLFPQKSGRIRLPGPVLEAQVPDTRASDPFSDKAFGGFFGRNPFAGMMGATRPLRLQGDPIELDARPRPPGVGDWLPARQVKLEESWRPADGALHAGEPITRHLSLSALGLTAAQLPDLAARMALPDGIKAYPDQAGLNTTQEGDSVRGSREQDIALIASQPGRYQIPPLHLAWWDSVEDRAREAVLPARTLEILPTVAGAAPVAPPTPAPSTSAAGAEPLGPLAAGAVSGAASYWPWVSLALSLLWLATLAAWWRSRRTKPQPSPAVVPGAADTIRGSGSLKACRLACRDHAAAEARRQLLAWSRATWPADPPTGLNALARLLADPVLSKLLRELDRACYTGGEWNGAALAEALAVLPARPRETVAKASLLSGLYP